MTERIVGDLVGEGRRPVVAPKIRLADGTSAPFDQSHYAIVITAARDGDLSMYTPTNANYYAIAQLLGEMKEEVLKLADKTERN